MLTELHPNPNPDFLDPVLDPDLDWSLDLASGLYLPWVDIESGPNPHPNPDVWISGSRSPNQTKPRSSRLRWTGASCPIQHPTRGMRYVNAHAEQEGFEPSRNGNCTSIKAANDCHNSKWVFWNERGSNSARTTPGFARDSKRLKKRRAGS